MGVALTKARNPKDDTKALGEVRDELERLLAQCGFCEGKPFSWITIAIRFGLKDETKPHYHRISGRHGDLPLSIEINTERILEQSLPALKQVFREAALLALVDAGRKYKCDVSALEAARRILG